MAMKRFIVVCAEVHLKVKPVGEPMPEIATSGSFPDVLDAPTSSTSLTLPNMIHSSEPFDLFSAPLQPVPRERHRSEIGEHSLEESIRLPFVGADDKDKHDLLLADTT